VACKASKLKNSRIKVTCTVRLVSVKAKAMRVRARLTRHGVVYASASTKRPGARLQLVARRRIRAGRYTLTIASTDGKHRTTIVNRAVTVL
jgi:hypothetical protein